MSLQVGRPLTGNGSLANHRRGYVSLHLAVLGSRPGPLPDGRDQYAAANHVRKTSDLGVCPECALTFMDTRGWSKISYRKRV